jgi:hypothetical protein
VFKSTDGGANWATANTGLNNTSSVPALAIDPTTPTTLYAGTNSGVFKSTDGGATWAAINTGLASIIVRALALNPATPNTLYAGMGGTGVIEITFPPEMTVLGNSVEIADGDTSPTPTDHTDFGSTGQTLTRTFTISNTGPGSLILNGTPKVVLSGANAAD